MEKTKNWGLFLRRNIAPMALVILCVFFMIMNPRFISLQNLGNILKQATPLLIISAGATFVILMAGIDLSVDGLVALCGIASVLISRTLPEQAYAGWLALIGAALLGMLVGAAIGFVFTHFDLPSFLVSFGFSTICYGIGLIVTDGATQLAKNQAFKNLGVGSNFGLPNLAIFAIAVMAVTIFIGNRTRFGRYIYAIGGGERVAELCGIPIKRYKTMAFMLAGALTGLAGGLLSARLGAASVTQGQGAALDAIAGVVMGGTSLSGGKGSVARTIAGVFVIVLMSNGLNLMGVPYYSQVLIKGVVVIVAVAALR
jgi:ribose/xylose/arabinose/galactoside ABC-type transport system permease subunit